MDLKQHTTAALLSGLLLSPAAVLAFGADVHTSPNFQNGEVAAEVIEKAKAKRQQRPAIQQASCSNPLAADLSCEDKDSTDADSTTTLSN